jgi:hypothetical protein
MFKLKKKNRIKIIGLEMKSDRDLNYIQKQI